LYIGGAGLARAYLRQPSLTAERFVPHPWSQIPGGRLYRSGDRVRLMDDGTVEFVERVDAQVKIRGFRVDLGEIETHLRALPSVQDAVVVTRNDGAGNAQVVAYLIAADNGARLTARELRGELQANLPKYMLPSAVVWLDAIPLTENGKLDRRALPEPMFGDAARQHIAARSTTEKAIVEIWSEVLGGTRAGIHDDFFELGGHSLLATQVISRLRQRFRNDLSFQIIFDCPTVEALAEAIDGAAGMAAVGEPREEFEL
jgi:acyl carrier protein